MMINEYKAVSRKTGEFITGQLFKVDSDYCILDKARADFTQAEEVIPTTIGQYIGVSSPSGEKIFAGDIVQWENCKGVVMYMPAIASYVVFDGNYCCHVSLEYSDITLLGNVHEPEGRKLLSFSRTEEKHYMTIANGYDGYVNRKSNCACYPMYNDGSMGCKSFCEECKAGYLLPGEGTADFFIEENRPETRK
jgi:hypothetical protein